MHTIVYNIVLNSFTRFLKYHGKDTRWINCSVEYCTLFPLATTFPKLIFFSNLTFFQKKYNFNEDFVDFLESWLRYNLKNHLLKFNYSCLVRRIFLNLFGNLPSYIRPSWSLKFIINFLFIQSNVKMYSFQRIF